MVKVVYQVKTCIQEWRMKKWNSIDNILRQLNAESIDRSEYYSTLPPIVKDNNNTTISKPTEITASSKQI